MRFLFAAGGTGGTVLPGIVVAKAIQAIQGDAEILFVGTARGFETTLVPRAGFSLELMNVGGLKRKGIFERLRNALLLPVAFWKSWRLLSRFRPAAVFGTGGYASGPVLLTASLRRIRTAILEPNSVPGFANRVLARFVGRVFVAFEEAAAGLPEKKCVVTGNPIRAEILAVPPPAFDGEKRTVLIFGGSQGARRLNEAMEAALDHLKPERDRFRFFHQTGPADEERVKEAYRSRGFEAEVFSFEGDMASLYRRADLVVARSGSSVLEIAACGRPSILVPYPHSADDHQQVNARILEREGAALVVADGALDGPGLASRLKTLAEDPARMKAMSEGALKLRRTDAAERIARELMGEAAR